MKKRNYLDQGSAAGDCINKDLTQQMAGCDRDATLRAEMRALLEKKVDELPIALRTVFVMWKLEAMTVEETAECLGIPEATVRSRLSQAQSFFRTSIEREIDLVLPHVFAFCSDRCERTVAAVLGRITKDVNHT